MRDIGKRAISAIAIKNVRSAGKALRTARNGNIVVVAVNCLSRLGRARRIKIHVIGDKQIEVPVAIIVQKTAACAPRLFRAGDTSFFGDIREGPVAIIVVEDVVPPIADKQIVEAIVIIVTDATSLSPTRMGQTSLLSDIRKGPVTVVVKEVTRGLTIALTQLEARTVYQKNVDPAIIVVIEEGYAATHLFQQKLLVRGAARNILSA